MKRKGVILPRIRHLRSIIASSLLFGFIGTTAGTVIFLTVIGVVGGRPMLPFRVFDNFDLALSRAAFLGAVPAFATGIAAGVIRIYVRSLLILAILMALLGTIITAIYLMLTGARYGDLPLAGAIALTGGVTAFCCSFLLWRSRPWTIPAD